MSRFITTKADFTLRRKHKKASGATVYEHDYTTITPLPNAFKQEYVIGDSNFKFTTRLGVNGQKKHTRGKYVPNPMGEVSAWTLDTIVDSGITEEGKVRLKPNYTSLEDFACYGSANKLVQGTINGVIMDFPAELYFSGEQIKFYLADSGAGYTFNDEKPLYSEEYLIYNEYGIDIYSKVVQENSVYNPLRYLCLCGSSYTLVTVDSSGNTTGEYAFTGFDVKDTALGEVYNGICVEVDKLKEITFNFDGWYFGINIYKDYTDGTIYYTYRTVESIIEAVNVIGQLKQQCNDYKYINVVGTLTQGCTNFEIVNVSGTLTQECGNHEEYVNVNGTAVQDCENSEVPVNVNAVLTQLQNILGGASKMAKRSNSGVNYGGILEYEVLIGGHIRPKKTIVEQYFNEIDDFTAVLLDRTQKPIYTAVLKTPQDSETGMSYTMERYTWPSLLGGYNPDLSGAYYPYVESLIDLADFYDEYFTDNMWRSLTHEAIKTLDWTYVSNTDGDIEDMSQIDTSRIEPITKIYGRQFDDLKRYIDGIKTVNTITYNQRSNVPDYFLTDMLENCGWETRTLKITSDKDIRTESLYSGLTMGYTSPEASCEFLRRLELNSRYLFSVKGTRKGVDAILSLFGFTPDEYNIHEYIYVATPGNAYTPFCETSRSLPNSVSYEGETYIKPVYPNASDVETINSYKVNFDINDPYGPYCGIPVREVGYFVPNPSDSENPYNYSYVVPWYSNGKQYDDGLYFQMNGGWGKSTKKLVDLEIAPNVHEITERPGVALYDETQARMKFAQDFDDMLQEAFTGSNLHDVFYVTDISSILDDYSFKTGEAQTGLSHYFVLENLDQYQFVGYNENVGQYGWRNIKETEITANSSTAGTLVLYLETIQDDTTGNNPHVGGGTYDDGSAYVESITDIFNYSLVNRNFIGIDDDTCERIKDYVFDKERQEDNRKCWFFSDGYDEREGKNGESIQLREGDVTSERCDIRTFYDPLDVLTSAGENATVRIGKNAGAYFQSQNEYTRGSSANTFDPENNRYGSNGEAAANSVINVKTFEVNFDLGKFESYISDGISTSLRDALIEQYKQYIRNTVVPYLTQFIPSTSILSWGFTNNGSPEIVVENIGVDAILKQGQCPSENNETSSPSSGGSGEIQVLAEFDDSIQQVTVIASFDDDSETINVVADFDDSETTNVVAGFDDTEEIQVLAGISDNEEIPVLAGFENDDF